jgi:RHS repeat-associated protein
MSLRRLLLAAGAAVLLGTPVRAADPTLEALKQALARPESPARTAASVARAEGDGPSSVIRALLPELERRHRARRASFAAVAAKPLSPRAQDRLARARAAYEAGQGRLLAIVRRLVGADVSAAADRRQGRSPEAERQEALDILERLEAAQQREPWSASDLKVKAPELRAPALPSPLGPAAAAATTAQDVQPVGYIHPAVKALADTLADPIDVYEWVRNQIRPEFYHGVMKGPLETMREGGGNDADTAGLLIALLGAKGIPARFVRGTVELPGPVATRLTGTASADQAIRVFTRAGIPNEPQTGTAGVGSVRIERVWAEAYLAYINYRGAPVDGSGRFWIPLDAAWKPLADPRGVDVLGGLGLDARAVFDEYLKAPQTKTPRAFLEDRVKALLAERRPGTPYESVPNLRGFFPETLGLLPSSLPYRITSVSDYGNAPPEELRHTVRLFAEAGGVSVLDATFPSSDLLAQRLTISYVPFSDDDEATVRRFGGLLQTPPYLVDVRVVVKLGGVAIASGDSPVGLGVQYTFGLDVKTPGGIETVRNRLVAGNLVAIGLNGSEAIDRNESRDDAARVLSGLAYKYLDKWNRSDEALADLFRVAPVRPTLSACFVLSDIQVEYAGGDPLYPVSFDWKGIAVDADLRASAPVAVDNRDAERAFLLWSGLEGSVLEHRLFEDELKIPSVSTAKALQLASAQDVEVLDLDRGNVDVVLPGLPLDALVKADIQDATGRGLLARVPARPVTSLAWTGVGYLLLDTESGEAAWQLQGGHSGGVTAPSVFDLPQDLVDVLRQASETPASEPAGVAEIQKYATGDFQFGIVNKELEKPLKVLVTDADGYPVPNAPVTFRVIGGEGELRSPAGDTGAEVTVLSCDVDALTGPCKGRKAGEAFATLKLGKRTNLIPRYFCEEGRTCECPAGQTCNPDQVDYATQVGVNLVTAFSGAAQLPEPFTAFGKPDDQFDGTLFYVYLSFATTPPESVSWANLTVPDRTAIFVNDLYGNPISNAHIRFKYQPDPVVGTPPAGQSLLRPGTSTPGHVLTPSQYEKCLARSASVIYGQCEGESQQAEVKSSTFGSFAYPLLGDSPYSAYIYHIGTDIEPDVLFVSYGTTGVLCPYATADSCGHWGKRPWLGLSQGTRPYLVNPSGNLVEAYPLGGVGTLGVWADMIEEGYSVETFRTDPDDREDHYRVLGTNAWVRKHLEDSRFALSAKTPGTGVPAAAAYAGNGSYVAPMQMAGVPQLNTVDFNGVHTPAEFFYRSFYNAEVYPQDVNGAEVQKHKYRPWSGEGDFSLWGIEPVITEVKPSPVLVNGAGLVTRASGVKHEIRPEEYRQLLDDTQVRFDLKATDATGQLVDVMSAFGADGSDYEIPVGLSLPPGLYRGQLSVRGVSTVEQRKDVSSPFFDIPVCSPLDLLTPVVLVGLTRDPLNDRTCQNDGTLVFLMCRDAKVTLTLDGRVLSAPVDGQTGKTTLDDLPLPAGLHKVSLPAEEFSLLLDQRTPFHIEAKDATDPALVTAADGEVVNVLVNRSVLPVGHTIVKGVDLLDGHLVQQSTDLQVPGRHIALEVTRTYSSAGRNEAGTVGAGWAMNYDSRVTPADCGVAVVQTADGSSQVFQQDGTGFKPQKGYHTKLVKNGDGTYDFTDKGGSVHHFRQPENPLRATGSLRLDYVREPHGDRLQLTYDTDGRVTKVAEMQGGSERRALALGYKKIAGFDRVTRAEVADLHLRVDYEYDVFGNLLKATRRGENVDGGESTPDRVESYEYSTQDASDRHQMTAAVDPNQNRREYRYYARADTFPGEGGGFSQANHEEFVKEVAEFTRPGVATTRVAYDVSQVLSKREWHTTVRDGRGNDTVYVLNGNGSPLRIEEPLGKTTNAKWAADDIFKTEATDALGRLTRFGHDDRANLTEETIETADYGKVTTHYEYEPKFNKMTLKVDPNGNPTTWTIDPTTGDVTEMKDAEGNVTGYEYNGGGELTATIDARGHRTEYSNHNSFGSPQTIQDAEGNVTTLEYDERNRLTRKTDSLGRETRQEYDGLDRVTRVVRVAGHGSDDEDTATSYYPGGQPRSIRTANGATTELTLDGLNRVTGTRTTFGDEQVSTATSYDPNGNKETETDRRGVKRKNSFDALNRLVKVEIVAGLSGEGPLGQVATYEYDKVGNKTSETDVARLTTRYVYDGLYRVKEKTLPEGPAGSPFRELFGYDKVGNRTSFVDANGHPTTYGYDHVNRLIRTTNALGQDLLARYDDPEGSHLNKSEESDPVRGLRTTFRYDRTNRVTSKHVRLEGAGSNGEDYVTTYTYADAAHAVTVRDPRGTSTRTVLDGLDRPTQQTVDPGGLDLTTDIRYDGLGGKKEVVDPRRNATTFDHDALGRLRETTDALGRKTTYRYDGEGLKTSETDRRGVRKTFTYDNLARPRRSALVPRPEMSGVSWSTEIEYQDVARKRVLTDARGFKTTQVLDGLDRVTIAIDPFGKQVVTEYDGVNKRSETDKRGHKTRFDYDPTNRLVKVTDPDPDPATGPPDPDPTHRTTETFYDDAQNRRRERNRRGVVKTTQMDPLGRALSVTQAGVVLERNHYDGNGNKESQTDAEDRVTRFEYDAANRLAARVEGFGTADGATTTFAYDKNGNQTIERDQRAADLGDPFSVERGYDVLNRLETVTDGELHTTTYGYDEEGNRTLVRPPKGNETTYAYDELGKLVRVTQPGGLATVYGYDESRNRTSQKDANSHTVGMTYDKLNRLARMEQPGGLVTIHGYDEDGNETLLTDPNSQTVTSTYDERSRLKTKAFALAAGALTPWRYTTGLVYTYDPNGNLTGLEETVASRGPPASSEALATTRVFDDLDRLTSETTTLPDQPAIGPRTRTVQWEYYGNGNRRSVTDPEGRRTEYTYDGQNRLKTATTDQGSPTAAVTTYTYWPDDLLRTVASANGVTATHTYDKADRLVSLVNDRAGVLVSRYDYGYDPNGNRISQTETNGLPAPVTEATAYTYDDLDRLETVTYPDKKLAYGYDNVGNRRRETERDLAGNLLSAKVGDFDDNNRLKSLTESRPGQPDVVTVFTYDANGNQLTKQVGASAPVEYRYDVRDRMVEVAQAASILGRYQYDGQGRRSKKIGDGGDQIQFLYDQTSTLVEYGPEGAPLAKYDWGSDRLISLTRSGEGRRYFSFDGLRSVTNLTTDGGAPAAAYHLDAWGNYRQPTELDASKNRFGFTGYYFDEETGLYDAKARLLDPKLGRFLTQDAFLGEIDQPPTTHKYLYANDNPVRFVDPGGHAAEELIHAATPTEAASIVEKGFKPGEGGYTWFASREQGLGGPAAAAKTTRLTVSVPNTQAEMTITPKQLHEFGVAARNELAQAGLEGKQLEKAVEARRWALLKEYMAAEGKHSYRVELGRGKGYYYVAKQAALDGATITGVSGEGAEAAAESLGKLQAEGGVVKAAAAARFGDKAASVLRIGGRTLVVVAVAADVYRIYRAEDTPREIAKVAGGWAGAAAGASVFGKGGAAAGAAIGAPFGGVGAGPGAAVGGITGAIFGGIAGYYAGEKAAEETYDYLFSEGTPAVVIEKKTMADTAPAMQPLPSHTPPLAPLSSH